MKTNFFKKHLSFFLCMVLIVAMALSTFGCNGKQEETLSGGEKEAEIQTQTDEQENEGSQADGNVLGNGDTEFALTVVDQEGEETEFEIHTDKETVGEALLEAGLIEGDESEYGLYVKTVNGITADYDKDGTYWAFYINDEYAQTGVDSTLITEGDRYAFRIE